MNSSSLASPVNGGVRKVILIIAVLVGSISAFMTTSLNVALPVIGQEFNADAILLNWVFTSFILFTAIFSVPAGRIADIIGLKKVFAFGLILFLIIAIIAAFSNSIIMLIVCRSIQGIGTAMIAGTIVAMLTIVFPAKQRGRALGLYISSIYAWLSVSPLVGGLLTEHSVWGWRSIFIFSLPFGLFILVLLLWKVKGEWAECRGEKFDYTGAFIFGLALVAVMLGFSQLPHISGAVLILAGIAGMYLFFRWEDRTINPILNINMFRGNRPFVTANLASIITYSTTSAVAFMLNLYLQYIKGFSPDQAGLLLIMQPVIQTAVAPFTGRLSDKIEPRLVASVGMAFLCAGLLLLSFLNNDTPLAQILVALGIIGLGFGLFVPPNTNAIMSSIQPRYYAVASSLTSTMRTIGQTLSMGITMVIMAMVIGRVVIMPENYPAFLTSTNIAFTIFAILCFTGIFASMMGGIPHRKPQN